MPEDQAILKHIIRRIEELGVQPYTMQRVLNAGHGAVFVADAVIQYLVRDTGTYDLVDLGRQNLELMQATIKRGLEGHNGIWDKFERFASAQSPVFAHGLHRAWGISNVVQGSIYELPRAVYDASFTFYCPESITDDVTEFEAATKSFVTSVKQGGLVVMAFMQGSQGYDTPGQYFPAVPIYCDDVRDLLSRYLYKLEVIPIDAPRGARPADGPQYAGMGLASGIRC